MAVLATHHTDLTWLMCVPVAIGALYIVWAACAIFRVQRPKGSESRDDERHLETLKWLYVDGGIDQPEFERRVAAALRGGDPKPAYEMRPPSSAYISRNHPAWLVTHKPPRPESDTLCLTSK